jgi:NAD(P)-dependent dehydrogenase (short-subunit alcohol dehydrogenase family)
MTRVGGGMADAGSRELEGRVAIVTGSGRNIGRAIALALAGGGASVVVNARSNRSETNAVVREIERDGGRAVAHLADVTDPEAVVAMAKTARGQFGRIDILVNNAANRDERPFADMTELSFARKLACRPCAKAAPAQSSTSGASAPIRARAIALM